MNPVCTPPPIFFFKMNCKICNSTESKYKCPKCIIKYCSVSCYKIHSSNCIPIQIQKQHESPLITRNLPDDCVLIPDTELSKLKQNSKIMGMLKNKSFRKRLEQVSFDDPDVFLNCDEDMVKFVELVNEQYS